MSEVTQSGACIMHNARDIVGVSKPYMLLTSADYASQLEFAEKSADFIAFFFFCFFLSFLSRRGPGCKYGTGPWL